MAWNIRAGGGYRSARILHALCAWRPDLVVLSEFRDTAPSRALAASLAELGLEHQRSSVAAAAPSRNALLVASRRPLRPLPAPPVADSSRLLRASLPLATPPAGGLPRRAREARVQLTAIHVPNRATGRKYGFLDAVLEHARTSPAHELGIIVGDTNSGWRGLDEQSSAFNAREEGWLDALHRHGWVDAFRHLHGPRRAYSWHSPNADNGFRLDQLLATRGLLARLRRIEYRWAERDRRAGVSDHAAIVADFE